MQKDKTRFKLDFRTKLLMTIVLSYTLLLGNLQDRYLYVAVIASALPYVLLCLKGKYNSAIKGLILILAAAFIQNFFVHKVQGIWISLTLFFAMIILRMAPGIMMGKYAFSSTTMSEFVLSMRKMHTPDTIIIPMTVMSRFFYTVKIDYRQIKDAMYLHGLTTSKLLREPMKLFEYRTIPLFMCLMRTADEVSVSAMTRGLERDGERSSITESKFSWLDGFFFFLMFILIAFYIRGKYA